MSAARVDRAHRVEDELLRLLAGTAAARTAERENIDALAARVGQGTLWRAMHAQHCAALLGARLLEMAPGRVSAELRRRIEIAVGHHRDRNLALEALTVRYVRALAEAGIAALPLKGVLLAARIHGDSALRQASDIDLLVAPEQLGAAREVMLEWGYREPEDVLWENALPLLHYVFAGAGAWRPPVEVHWRIHWYETRFSAGMLARSEPDARYGRIAQPADELAALLAFYARDACRGLRLAADIAAWWDAHGAALEPEALEPVLDDAPELAASLMAAAAAAAGVVQLPNERLFAPSRKLPRGAAAAARLADWRQSSAGATAEAEVTLLDLMLSPPGQRGRWVRRNLFQPLDHVARERGLRGRPAPELALRSAAHGMAVSARFARPAGAALLRARSAAA